MKNLLFKIFGGKTIEVKLNYDDFSLAEKVDLASVWRGYGKVSKKLEEFLLTRILLEKAETPEQIKFAREIIGMQNDFMQTCYEIIERDLEQEKLAP